MPNKTLRFLFLALVALLLSPRPAGADAASPWVEAGETSVRLVSATRGVGDEATLSLGLHFRLGHDWKIYWRSPGDAGYPPQPVWDGSENLKETEILWPAPKRFSILGIDTLGYKDEVLLPLRITPETPGAPVNLKASVDYLACSDICVPYRVDVALDLPAGPAEPSAYAHLIGRFTAQVPGDGSAVGLELVSAEAAEANLLRITARSTAPFTAPDLYVEGPALLRFDPPVVRAGDDGKTMVLDVPVDGIEDVEGGIEGKTLTFTIVDGKRAAEAKLTVAAPSGAAPPPAAAPMPAPVPEDTTSLAVILALALLGGVILNLMPCVLPVLSIKLLGVVGHGGGEKRLVRVSFVFSALGILTAFAILAGALIALKGAGAAIGWGIQFQQPWFLAAMTVIVVLFACNLWGFFEVRLPTWISDMGEGASHVHGLGGHFLTGMLATLLATPCSAPFLGTAVGFALSRGTFEIMAVFLALGLGLAAPYLLVAAAPGLATRLPKPGRWMVILKQVLGFALAATAVWLVGILVTQMGASGAAIVGACAVAMAVALYLHHRRPKSLGKIGGWSAGVLAAATIAAAVLADGGGTTRDPTKGLWRPFDEAAIPALVAEGKVVFVDVTAEWCITCQVNKAVALGNDEVLARLTGGEVIAMQADWTRPDPVISEYLRKFGRYGIPFNAVYGKGTPGGHALPELLTPDLVLDALDKASRP